jgi:hypothetical protein
MTVGSSPSMQQTARLTSDGLSVALTRAVAENVPDAMIRFPGITHTWMRLA